MTVHYRVGDVFDRLAELPDGSVDLILTSPPFLSLRDYLPADHPDKAREIGSEATPAEFLDVLLDLTDEWGRVLAPHGSICVELGDTYSGTGGAGRAYEDGGQATFDGSASKAQRNGVTGSDRGRPPRAGRGNARFREGYVRNDRPGRQPQADPKDWQRQDGTGRRQRGADEQAGILAPRHRPGPGDRDRIPGWPLAKSLACIPALYEASLAYGRNLLNPEHTIQPWRVRNLIAWVRPNPPVGALGDKVRPGTSYLIWACRSDRRWFDLDAVRTPLTEPDAIKRHTKNHNAANPRTGWDGDSADGVVQNRAGAPPLDWWKIVPKGYEGAHYAVFPPELCRIPIEASCPRRVCLTCGTPSARISDPRWVDAETDADADAPRADIYASETERDVRGMAARNGGHARVNSSPTTTGWTTCGCPGAEGLRLDGYHTGPGWRPGLVLDPFAGSGTTLLAAHGLSRDALGFDLDARNLDLARDRLGMFLDVDEPGGDTETVEAL